MQFELPARRLTKIKKYLPQNAFELASDVISRWQKERALLNQLRKGIIHNDFHDNNILVRENKVVGIVDFGDAMYSWYAADVAIALTHLCFHNKDRVISHAKAFLKGYFRKFSLTPVEKQYLPFLIQMRAALAVIECVFVRRTNEFERRFFADAVFTMKYFNDPKNLKSFSNLLQ